MFLRLTLSCQLANLIFIITDELFETRSYCFICIQFTRNYIASWLYPLSKSFYSNYEMQSILQKLPSRVESRCLEPFQDESTFDDIPITNFLFLFLALVLNVFWIDIHFVNTNLKLSDVKCMKNLVFSYLFKV